MAHCALVPRTERVAAADLRPGDRVFAMNEGSAVVAFARVEGNAVLLRMRYSRGHEFPVTFRVLATTQFVRAR